MLNVNYLMSNSNSKTNQKFSNIKFFTSTSTQKQDKLYLGNKINRELTVSPLSNSKKKKIIQ